MRALDNLAPQGQRSFTFADKGLWKEATKCNLRMRLVVLPDPTNTSSDSFQYHAWAWCWKQSPLVLVGSGLQAWCFCKLFGQLSSHPASLCTYQAVCQTIWPVCKLFNLVSEPTTSLCIIESGLTSLNAGWRFMNWWPVTNWSCLQLVMKKRHIEAKIFLGSVFLGCTMQCVFRP